MALSLSQPGETGSKSIKKVKIDPRSILKLLKQHSAALDTHFGVIPSDAELISLQKKEASAGEYFHVFRLLCKTDHPEELPVDKDGNPATNLQFNKLMEGDKELLTEVHRH